MAGMSDQEKRTREARLIASPPEAVYRELKIYGEDAESDDLARDEEMEKNLLAREDPLIDLALACYASDENIIGELYRKGLEKPATSLDGRYRKGLRIACLSNQVVYYGGFPIDVIGKEETDRIFAEADWQEAEALLSNPKLNDDILVALYQRSDSLAALPDDRWCDLVSMSAKNPRIVTRNDTDDYPDTGHHRIHRAIFGLLSIAPTTPRGLHTLYRLLDTLDPEHVHWPEGGIDTELSRWSAVHVDGFRGQPYEGHFTPLTFVDEFRCLVAAMYGKSLSINETNVLGPTTSKVLGTPTSADVAVRCAYYGKADLDQNAMKEGYQKDGDVFAFAVLFNDHVFHPVFPIWSGDFQRHFPDSDIRFSMLSSVE